MLYLVLIGTVFVITAPWIFNFIKKDKLRHRANILKSRIESEKASEHYSRKRHIQLRDELKVVEAQLENL